MTINIPIGLKRLVETNQQIIHSLKVQKARQDQMLDKYENMLKDELEIPSNRFLPIYKSITPFLDNVISSKLMDYELIKHLESFSKELIRYNADFIISEEQITELEEGFDKLLDNCLELESRFSELQTENEYLKAAENRVDLHQVPNTNNQEDILVDQYVTNTNNREDILDNQCIYCDTLLYTEKEISQKTCELCSENNNKEIETDEEMEELSNEPEKKEEEIKKIEVIPPKDPLKPEVRKGFQNLIKDFDKKYREEKDKRREIEEEKINHLDAI